MAVSPSLIGKDGQEQIREPFSDTLERLTFGTVGRERGGEPRCDWQLGPSAGRNRDGLEQDLGAARTPGTPAVQGNVRGEERADVDGGCALAHPQLSFFFLFFFFTS